VWVAPTAEASNLSIVVLGGGVHLVGGALARAGASRFHGRQCRPGVKPKILGDE
jgi:hypothetical protein